MAQLTTPSKEQVRQYLMLAFATRSEVQVTCQGNGRLVTVNGIIESIEHEDGSGFSFNIRIATPTRKGNFYFKCGNDNHTIKLL